MPGPGQSTFSSGQSLSVQYDEWNNLPGEPKLGQTLQFCGTKAHIEASSARPGERRGQVRGAVEGRRFGDRGMMLG